MTWISGGELCHSSAGKSGGSGTWVDTDIGALPAAYMSRAKRTQRTTASFAATLLVQKGCYSLPPIMELKMIAAPTRMIRTGPR